MENFFSANLAHRVIRKLYIFFIPSCDLTRFCSLRLLELGNSPRALVVEAPTLLQTLIRKFGIRLLFFSLFTISYFSRLYFVF